MPRLEETYEAEKLLPLHETILKATSPEEVWRFLADAATAVRVAQKTLASQQK